MGITGLHSELKPYCRRVHVEQYRGKRLAADGYSWLHKGVYSCASLVAQGSAPWLARGRRAPYVEYCLKRMRMLRHFGVEPLLVFDGDRLPAKAAEESERRERRAARQAEGHAALARGDSRAAESAFQSAIDVTPAMAREVMDGLAAEGFAFVVAPYEADSQLAHLARTGAVDIVATEDSDLAAYAVPLILFKLDQHGGAVELRIGEVLKRESRAVASDGAAAEADDSPPAEPVIEVDDDDAEEDGEDAPVLATRRSGGGKGSRGGGAPLSFRRFDAELFLCLCVLAGCDFLRSLPGVGFRRAHVLCLRAGTAPRLLALLRRDVRLAAPPAYVAGFVRALHTFRHARVYDAAARAVRPLAPLPPELLADGVSTAFLGPEVPDDEARGVAEGRLDPFTRRPFAPRPQPGAKGGHGRPPGSSPMRAWPYDSAAPRRRSGDGDGVGLRISPRRQPRPPPPQQLPPAPMNTSLSGMGHLFGAVAPPPPMPMPVPMPAETAEVWEVDDVALVSHAPLAPPPPRAANPFVRQPGDGKPMPQRVSSMFARAAADAVGKENGKAAAPPPPPPAMPAVPRGPLGRMWSGALSNGMAWIPDAEEQAGTSRPSQQPQPKPSVPKQPATATASGIARFFSPAGTGATTAAKRPGTAAAASAPKRHKS